MRSPFSKKTRSGCRSKNTLAPLRSDEINFNPPVGSSAPTGCAVSSVQHPDGLKTGKAEPPVCQKPSSTKHRQVVLGVESPESKAVPPILRRSSRLARAPSVAPSPSVSNVPNHSVKTSKEKKPNKGTTKKCDEPFGSRLPASPFFSSKAVPFSLPSPFFKGSRSKTSRQQAVSPTVQHDGDVNAIASLSALQEACLLKPVL